MKNGVVYLVGAGPGDPELLTLKGERRLKTCEVLIYDRLASDNLLDLVPVACEKIYVGKEVGNHSWKQEEINELLVKKALEGKRVVRLKGGDPFVFGRGGEEVLTLKEADIPYEVIPGITSAIAAAAYAGIPVTHRGVSQSFHVITGHTKDSDNELTDNFETLAKLEGTLVFLMGMNHLHLIVEELCKYGKDENTPVAVISNGTTSIQKTVKGTLCTIVDIVKEKGIKAPAIILIGDVAKLDMRSTLKGRLSNVKIGVTGTGKITEKLEDLLKDQGALVQKLDYLKVVEYKENKELIDAIHNLNQYTWVVFTSTNGVDIFFRRLKENAIDLRKLANLKFAVVGNGTKEALLKYGFLADYTPEIYSTKALAEGMVTFLDKTDNLLIPRALKGSKELTEILDKHSISYVDIKVYDIETDNDKVKQLPEELSELDYLTFASGSGVDGIFESLGQDIIEKLRNIKIVCIGDITAQRLSGYGIENYITANEFSVPGMVESILEDFGF